MPDFDPTPFFVVMFVLAMTVVSYSLRHGIAILCRLVSKLYRIAVATHHLSVKNRL